MYITGVISTNNPKFKISQKIYSIMGKRMSKIYPKMCLKIGVNKYFYFP